MGDSIHADFQHELLSSTCVPVFFYIIECFLGKIDCSHLCTIGCWDLVTTNSFKDGLGSSIGYNQIDQVRIWIGIAFKETQ
jgi:hypothetical protein